MDNIIDADHSLYEMSVDLTVLDHLGINLYSNVAAVITEAVANAWDADATEVRILVDEIRAEGKRIVITDNGIGMSIMDMNGKYLRVGYRRRDLDTATGRVTAKGRPVMGRKGLGKLSLFSIAEEIEVQTRKQDVSHGLRMTIDGIRKSAKANEKYHPVSLPDHAVDIDSGTRITLTHIKRERLGRGIVALRKRLARRFSILGHVHDFMVYVNDIPITVEDREDLRTAQFLWILGDTVIEDASTPNVKERGKLKNKNADWDETWELRGWLGTAKKPKELDNDDSGNLNGIVVFSRGRLFHENILDKLNDGRIFTKYLTGQIEADFMDTDDDEDIATSDRQRIQEDDPRYTKLIQLLKEMLNKVDAEWNQWRSKHAVLETKALNPTFKLWLEQLPEGHQDSALKMVGKLGSVDFDKDEDRKDLLKYGVLAFERMKLRGSVDDFVAMLDDTQGLLRLFNSRDSYEAALYRDIVKSRIEVIRALQSLVNEDQKESALRDHLFDHLWLLDPSWERASGSEQVEKSLKEKGITIDGLTKKQSLGRVDIRYKTYADKHLIVELKKAGRKMKLTELEVQGRGYVDTLRTILVGNHDIPNPNIEVIFVLGQPIDEELSNPERLKDSMRSIAPGSRIVHYDALINGALRSYSNYLEEDAKLKKLDDLLEQIAGSWNQ
ncbi:MAG: ATP-binding protein [bacterium]|nr:ATP-binding protein [bacterium]